MPRDVRQWAAKNDFHIRADQDGQTVTLWRPARTIPGGSPAEAAPVPLGEADVILLASGAAIDQAMLIGAAPGTVMEGRFQSTMAGILRMGMFVRDAGGVWWRIEGTPQVQRGGAGIVIGVYALLVLQSQQPTGIP